MTSGPHDGPQGVLETARAVLRIEAAAIEGLLPQLDEQFERAVEIMGECRGRIVCTGMGKSGHVMKKVAATLASTGTPAFFLHPAEAIHGDLGMIVGGDVVLAASFSGATQELLGMLDSLQTKGVPVIAVTGRPSSTLAQRAEVHLGAAIDREACPLNLAPTASTTATLALCDALAMSLLEARGFTSEDFAHLHPGGNLGRQFATVGQLMHQGDAVPSVSLETPLRDALFEMTEKGLGITAVVNADRELCGVISDGDLRRLLNASEAVPSELLEQPVAAYMKTSPKTTAANSLATAAIELMETHRITSIFVCDSEMRIEGVLHIHDLWDLRRT